MSKDMGNKGGGQSKPPSGSQPNNNPKTPAPSQPVVSRPSGAPQRPAPRSQQAPQRRPAQPAQSSAFGNRDLTLLIGGIMVVVFVVIGALLIGNNNTATPPAATPIASNTTDNTPVSDIPEVIMEPQVIATLTAQASNPAYAAMATAAMTAMESRQGVTPVPVPVGQLAPDFSLPGTDGKTHSLSEFRGKQPVLVEFMAPWCPHCQDDAKFLNEIYDKYNAKLQMLAVSAHPYGRGWEDRQMNPITMDDLTWFRDTYGVQYPMLYDPMVKSANDYGIEFFPTIYVLDIDGKVASQINAERGNPISTERIAGEVDKVVVK